MAGEGLFFTGQVLKNNRDLLAEEAAREQLKLQKEQLELQKENAAAQRRENRRKNQPSPLSFDSSSMGPEMGKVFQNNVLGYNKNISSISDAIINQDPEAINQQLDGASALKTDKGVFEHVWKEVSANRQIARGNNRDSLGTNEEGSYVFEDNYQSFLKAVGQGANPSEALEMYPIRKGAINETPFKNPINALYETKGSKMTTITNADGSQYKTLGDISKESETVVEGLTPDKNGNWDNPDMEKIYLGKEGLIEVEGMDGNMSFPAAFAFETRGIDIAGSSTFTDKLDPKKPDTYDPELANEYIQFIKNKSEEKAKRNYPNQTIKAKQDDAGNFQKNINKGKLVSVNDWNTMINSDKETEYTYGKHGKMLQEVKVAQKSATQELTSSMLENLEVSNRPVNSKGLTFDTETVKTYLSEMQGVKEAKLSQVLINSSHDNMYAIYEIEIPASVTDQGNTKVEISIPLDQVDKALYGKTTEAWYNSFKNRGLYNQEEETTKPTGVSAPRP